VGQDLSSGSLLFGVVPAVPGSRFHEPKVAWRPRVNGLSHHHAFLIKKLTTIYKSELMINSTKLRVTCTIMPHYTPLRQLVPAPVFRKLRVFAMDPGLTARFDTAVINQTTLQIPWEPLGPELKGEYVHIVDVDANGNRLYETVDLDNPDLLAQDGLAPSDGDPHFHQQMVYAVAMRTIHLFERCLGRLTHWPQKPFTSNPRKVKYERRLKLAPHFFAETNAYFNVKKSLFCFGYFTSGPETPIPNTQVFTCLSQDIIAHELTHGLLFGMSKPEGDPSNPDEVAFHEAFADLVALFLHFEESDVLRAQIASVRGRLQERSPLGAVALQFSQAIGKPDGMRNALGGTDAQGNWQPRRPDPHLYQSVTEPHERGDILVGAIFEAFRIIYESRVSDLLRLASRGTGDLKTGSLHPDLVNRLMREAVRAAKLVLDMCIRALDYMPPVGITFGDFLRAVLTADYDLEAADLNHYRVAMVEAFRGYGIFPRGVGTLSVETLLWPGPDTSQSGLMARFVHDLAKSHVNWTRHRDREESWYQLEEQKLALKKFLQTEPGMPKRIGAIDLKRPFEVHSLHPRGRTGTSGNLTTQWVIKLVQAPTERKTVKRSKLWAACTTLIIDANTGLIRYQIDKQLPSLSPRENSQTAATHPLPVAKTAIAKRPTERRLRVFAFDPTLGVQLETAGINEVTLRISWERDLAGQDLLGVGPVGEYLEVVDRDPASQAYYSPVNLNDPHLLAQDGLPPSEANPQFHQQMVYTVAMQTIRTFERALGRLALWSPRPPALSSGQGDPGREEEYVQRLRIYPHALREANAYYSPAKKAVLFGYFPDASAGSPVGGASLTVFTCLSHDIIAHEVTHALLDGMHRRFQEASNPDVLAFHEAFADLVALFQHFSLPEVLRYHIAATRGDLESQNRLGELAQQFGQAIGNRGALRSALGQVDPKTGKWQRADPDPLAYQVVKEPHARGAILVTAVFDAFLTLYKAAVADLLRIASEGTGVLPEGHLHPDLVARLSEEAAHTAGHVLNMCIRALDYCPPVDITFGDYLRAIVTADFEFDPVDALHRRVAFAEAFRRHGIVPEGVRTLSVDGLLWRPTSDAPDVDEENWLSPVRDWANDIASWSLSKDREALYKLMRSKRAALHNYLQGKLQKKMTISSGIDASRPFEVHSIRPSCRTDWQGRPKFQWVIELTQRIPEFVDTNSDGTPDYYFRGGCTLVVDAETGKVRYSVRKPLNVARREQQRRYLLEEGNENLAATYFGGVCHEHDEPFAMLHRL
jgi:hypothetical protein